MKPTIIAFLACLFVFHAQGQRSISSKCKCLNGYIGRYLPQHVKGEPVVYQPSVYCPHVEIIITTTADKKKCVNPQSPRGRQILGKQNKFMNNAAVTMMMTSSSTRQDTSTSQ